MGRTEVDDDAAVRDSLRPRLSDRLRLSVSEELQPSEIESDWPTLMVISRICCCAARIASLLQGT